MIAATYTPSAPNHDLSVRELPTPEPGPGEVRVRVRLAGVNPTDWKSRTGLTASTAPAAGAEGIGDFQVPCQDAAGTVDALGAGVDTLTVGQRVWIYFAANENRWGAAAQYSVLPAERVLPLPDDASDELGAGLGIPALTAAYCLLDGGPISDQAILITGGAGAVGNAAVALAKHAGAGPVIATVSSDEKAKLALAAGADGAVNYHEPDAAERIRALAPSGVRRIVDVDISRNLGLDLAVAAPRATIVSYAANPDSVATLPVRELMTQNVFLHFMLLYTVPHPALLAAAKTTAAALAAGALKATLPLHRFPLTRIAEAQDAVRHGAVGKVLVEIP
jgi:NADPH2:quinone reductase